MPEITILRTIHPAFDDQKLEGIKAAMLAGTSYEISVVEFGDHYMALEGSHRLWAAAELRQPVTLNVLSQSDLVDADALGLEGFEPGKTYPAGTVAQGLHNHHNRIMTINSDRTLSIVPEASAEEELIPITGRHLN
jgi:hypothetical protein